MNRALRALAALTLLAAPLAAQNPIGDRMLNLQGKGYPDEHGTCKLNGGDFHTTGAGSYLVTALTTPVADNKLRALTSGREQSLLGIQGSQTGS